MILGLSISRPILILLGDQGHILELAHLYTRIYFLGVPFIAVTNFFISIFRAKGDTRTPLVILTITGLLNVILNIFFVIVCKMSVDGVALATTISNLASMVALAMVLHKDKGWCRLEFKKLGIEKYALKGIIYNGFPAAIQGVLFSLSNMIIQSSIISINNRQFPGGSDIIDGNAAGQSIESFAYVATNSVCQAAVTFTSQHHGAKKYKRIGTVMRCCYFVTAMIAITAAAILLTLRRPLLWLYIQSGDPVALEAAYTRFYINIAPYFTLAFMEVGSGVLRGLGKSTLSTLISLIGSCVLRLVWIYLIFPLNPVLWMVYLSYPITWALTAATHFTVSMFVRRRYMRLYPEGEAE